jgi:choline dehydrogenase-like flavoprotein
MIEHAARELGLHPFRLPLAIHYQNGSNRKMCQACTTCDAFACAVEAKNDIATILIPALIARGMELRPRTVVTRLVLEGDHIVGVDCVDRDTGRMWRANGEVVVLAAGVLATPHLLLASGLERANPAGHAVGRYLMRHCNGLVYGFFRSPPNPAREFHKQIGIHDFYFGHPEVTAPRGKLGCIQQVMAPPIALVQARVPPLIGRVLSLIRQAKRVLRRAGAGFFYVHDIETFSHAVGSVRMGKDPRTSPLDEMGRFRGVRNLWVTDGCVMPTSAAVNPSLTISAIALRAGDAIACGKAA